MKTLILGLGNPILTDDGVGVKVAEAVQAALPTDVSVEVSEVSVGGLTLMERMVGYQRVILIDACTWTPPPDHSTGASERPNQRWTGQPGTIHRLTLEELRSISPTQHSVSSHDTSLATALEMGRQMGLSLPEEIIIYAIEVENVTDFGDEPTPAVARSIPQVTEAVLAELL